MDTNDFYEDDEPIEDLRAAWKSGERGVTSGSRDLNQRAKAIVDHVAARWDAVEPSQGGRIDVYLGAIATADSTPSTFVGNSFSAVNVFTANRATDGAVRVG